MLTKITVKVVTGSKKVEIIDNGLDNFGRQNFKVKVNQPPEDRKANQAVLEIIADYLKLKKCS